MCNIFNYILVEYKAVMKSGAEGCKHIDTVREFIEMRLNLAFSQDATLR